MKRTKQQTAQTRREIIEAAASLFREHGLDGVSVSELMDRAGLTHGGFYKHFDSKEALLAEATAAAFEESMRAWQKTIEANRDRDPIRALIELYLSEGHRKDLEHGCPVVSLGSEMTRSAGAVRNSFAKGVQHMVDVLEEQINAQSCAHSRDLAIAIIASMVGAMVIARCCENERTARSYLDSAREELLRIWQTIND